MNKVIKDMHEFIKLQRKIIKDAHKAIDIMTEAILMFKEESDKNDRRK